MGNSFVFYAEYLRKARNNAKALRAIMRKWFTGQANKKTLQLLGIPQQQERHIFQTGRQLRREHLLALAETEITRNREIDRAAERIIARTKRKVEFWRQKRQSEITKLAFDLRSLAERIEHQKLNDEIFLLVENRRKLIDEGREKVIARRLDIAPPKPKNTLWQGATPDISLEMLEAFPLYDERKKSK